MQCVHVPSTPVENSISKPRDKTMTRSVGPSAIQSKWRHTRCPLVNFLLFQLMAWFSTVNEPSEWQPIRIDVPGRERRRALLEHGRET